MEERDAGPEASLDAAEIGRRIRAIEEHTNRTRYITESEAFPGRVEIELVWRGATIRDETVREETLEAFRQELTDVLDWSTAQYSNSRMLLNT